MEYAYDVYDRRIAKSVDRDGNGVNLPEVERYVHDGDNLALVFDGSGNLQERFFYGVIVDQVLAQDRGNGSVLWGLGDNQGSIRLLTDSDGNVLNHINYDAFGKVTAETNAGIDFRFGYTGRELDEETGNYYYRSRYYDSSVGRFISEDSIGFEGGDANLYRYVGNGSVNYIDPFGYRIGFVPPPRTLPSRVPTVPSQPFFTPYRPNSVPSGYPVPEYPSDSPHSGFYDYSRTCITAPGDTCTPDSPNRDWAKEASELLNRDWAAEGIAESVRQQESGSSCPANYPYDKEDNDDPTVRVYRVESQGNERVIIDKRKGIAILGDKTLFLNFGQRYRALEFWQRRLIQYPDTPSTIKSFEVPASYLDELRSTAVPERLSRKNRNNHDKPIAVDIKQAPDQYGLRTKEQIDQLRSVIIQGTGKEEP